jgi:hypothetical protein
MRQKPEYISQKEDLRFSTTAFIRRIIKTFELINVDERLIKKIKTTSNNEKEAWSTLKKFNNKSEQDQGIKMARPILHGFNENDVFTKLIQEAYVTAKLFYAEDRMLNSMWSADWVKAAR